MGVPRFCNAGMLLLFSAGVFPRYKAEVGRKLLRGREPPEVPYFATEGQGGMIFYPYKATQLFYWILVPFALGQFLNTLIVYVHFFLRLVVQHKILLQNLVEYAIAKIQCFQPIQVPFCPIGLSIVLFTVPGT